MSCQHMEKKQKLRFRWSLRLLVMAVQNGITSGITTTTFSPGTACTRGQIVTFLHRYYT